LEKQSLINNLQGLLTEQRNPDTMDIDQLDSLGIVSRINQQDHQVAIAVEQVLPQIAQAVDLIVTAFKAGGRLIYIGAGTSGRLGVLDAVECVPTFGVDKKCVIGLIAGGEQAMFESQEGAEDQTMAAINDLDAIQFSSRDILVGIAASGRTPYVIAALEYAAQKGAKRVALSCNPDATIAEFADVSILPVVGAEALTGSTRLKAGSAQKMVLNMLSTAAMIRIGKSYSNLMVDLKASNDKLYARGLQMVMEVTGVNQKLAEETLVAAGKQVKLAIMMLLADTDAVSAQRSLAECGGFLNKALARD